MPTEPGLDSNGEENMNIEHDISVSPTIYIDSKDVNMTVPKKPYYHYELFKLKLSRACEPENEWVSNDYNELCNYQNVLF